MMADTRFFIDENLPRSAGDLLRRHGYEVLDVRDSGLRGASDTAIARYITEHDYCLISADMGFSDIRNYPPSKYHGIVVLRLPAGATSVTILSLLEGFVTHADIIEKISLRI